MKRRSAPLGWLGIAALAFGGANQSLYMLDGLINGQAGIAGQGAASLLLLAGGILLACLAAPGWLELVLMSPHRVGGIGAACGAAFRPYSPLLAALAGFCNWWGWAATSGLGATMLAGMIGRAWLPDVPVPLLGCGILAVLTTLALSGLRLAGWVSVLIAVVVLALAGASIVMPLRDGAFDVARLTSLPIPMPFPGIFGRVTGVMAGLFLVGYSAPCIEAALCYAGKARKPARDVKWAMLIVLCIGILFFVALPVIWFGVLGMPGLSAPLDQALRPTFAKLPAVAGHLGAVGLMTLCWIQTCIHALCGSPLTVAQLADDGMAPRALGRRSSREVPVNATLMTAGVAAMLVLINTRSWLQGAANFAYLIGIFLPSLAVWLLRRDQPEAPRLYTAPRYMLTLGLAAGTVWMLAALLGAEQFGLSIIVVGLVGAYSGAGAFALRKLEDRRRAGDQEGLGSTLYLDVMMVLLIVLILDAAGYIVALSRFGPGDAARAAELTDIFVAVALLSLGVSVVLPGRIAYATEMVGDAARRLAFGTLRDFSAALDSLGRGDLEAARMRAQVTPLPEIFDNELGELARNFNIMQAQVLQAAHGLENARAGLLLARGELTATNEELRAQVQEQERLTAELMVARDSATAGERSKTEFLAMMSHELRTPLNGVIGMAGLLLDGTLDAQSRMHARMLRDAGDHLLEMINDLLDLTKLEAGKIHFEGIGFDIEDVAQGALDLVAARAHAKSLGIGAFVSPDIPRRLVGDPSRLRQVLINLLGNAVKFTARGHVLLEVVPVEIGGTDVRLKFAVTDTGIGIAGKDLPHLFEVFSQLDNSTSRRFGGTGLGLAISQRIVTGLGGVIQVASKPDVGSTFHFELSLRASEAEADSAEDAARRVRRLRGERIIVLNADPFGGKLLARQIESRGGQVALTNSIAQAFSLIRSPPGKSFDAVVIDQGLPYGGAGKFASQLRADPAVSNIRMILTCTSEASSEPVFADLFDARLLKPVPLDSLIDRLASIEARSGPARPEPAAAARHHATPPPGRKLRILVAEDNQTNQAVIRAMLAKLEHTADIVGNGLAAVQAMAERSYDLVLMDVMMPELDGIAATTRIRALGGRASRIPIIALTADVSAENHVTYRAAGIQSVLTKPITLRALAAALDAVELVTTYTRSSPSQFPAAIANV